MLGQFKDSEFQKRVVFLNLFRYFRTEGFFLHDYENNSTDNLYYHSNKKKHKVWLSPIDLKNVEYYPTHTFQMERIMITWS